MKPVYTHDCTKCVLLGRYETTTGVVPNFTPSDEQWERTFAANTKKEYDLYFCGKQADLPTVIARYGDEGSHYVSGLHGAEHDEFLKAAKNLAIVKGLLDA